MHNEATLGIYQCETNITVTCGELQEGFEKLQMQIKYKQIIAFYSLAEVFKNTVCFSNSCIQ